MGILIKHISEALEPSDGARYLVCSKIPSSYEKLELFLSGWIKELSPGSYFEDFLKEITEESWKTFRRLYYADLISPEKEPFLSFLTKKAKEENITILFVEPDKTKNHAVVLKTLLELRMKIEEED